MNKNFILGRGEVLTSDIKMPKKGGKKEPPYTLDEAILRIEKQLLEASLAIEKLPSEACPNEYAVELFTLNPGFIAKSYFPNNFLRVTGLYPVGSRNVSVTPQKWNRKGAPQNCITTQLFIAGKKRSFKKVIDIVREYSSDTTITEDFRKIESVEINSPNILGVNEVKGNDYYEIGIHSFSVDPELVVESEFRKYAKAMGIILFPDEFDFNSGGLCFLPVMGKIEDVKKLAQFSFTRVIRAMPKLRSLPEVSFRANSNIPYNLPKTPPLDKELKAAILDGGIPDVNPILPWLASYVKMDDTASDVKNYCEHGLGVTSAFLFGPLNERQTAEQPYSFVSHFRILDSNTTEDDPLLLYRTLKMIEQILLSREYQFINLSLGPDLPIEDQDVHAWTSVIDDLLADGDTFLTVAAGNNGGSDRESGNARVQVPADCVNAIAVGAADSMGSSWDRATYSAIGPGRSPGFIKPDLLAFGGSPNSYFHVPDSGNIQRLIPTLGTSFSSPFLLRTAVGIKAFLGQEVSILAIKALLIHTAKRNNKPQSEVGWGKVEEDIDSIISCPDGVARILYQGELKPGKTLRAPIPIPLKDINGKIWLTATFCYSSAVDPQDSGNYTRSGLTVSFRPSKSRKREKAVHANTRSFFTSKEYATEDELRNDSGKWETVLHAEQGFLATTLSSPCFDIHYIARENGMKTGTAPMLKYALVISIKTPSVADISSRIVADFPQLSYIKPRIALPIKI